MNRTFKHNFLILAAVAVLAFAYHRHTANRFVPKVDFIDSQGVQRSLSPGVSKPALVALWVPQCGYSRRAMNLLIEVQKMYPAGSLDVIGFFGRSVRNINLEEVGKDEGYSGVILAGVYQQRELFPTLQKAFQFGEMGGQAINIIDRSGRIYRIDTSDPNKPNDKIKSEIISALKTIHI